jgi:hypothetical protein
VKKIEIKNLPERELVVFLTPVPKMRDSSSQNKLKFTPKAGKNPVNYFGCIYRALTFALPLKNGVAFNGQRSLKVGKQQHPDLESGTR